MAILSNRTSGHKICLRSQHVFGRDRTADTFLHGADASRLHASVYWTGDRWELRDHSKNGTHVDARRVPAGRTAVLRPGAMVAFGSHHADIWQVDDTARPGPMLWPLQGGEPVALTLSNLLPDEHAAQLSIHQSTSGEWICCDAQGARVLEDGDEVTFDGRAWCFLSGADVSGTVEHAGLAAQQEPTALDFHVSLDEEHTRLTIVHGGRATDLGERSHHYALLTLARLRAQDAQGGLDASAQGWVEHERLARMLGLEPSHLNIQLFRLRKQLAGALPRDARAPELVERRRGELRLAPLRFRVVRGTSLQAAFEPRAGEETRVRDLSLAA